MRQSLAALRGKRCRFSATFAGRSKAGHIILSDVLGPIGAMEQHLWVPSGQWRGALPDPGKHVELVALVEEYQRDRDNSVDFGLFSVQEVVE